MTYGRFFIGLCWLALMPAPTPGFAVPIALSSPSEVPNPVVGLIVGAHFSAANSSNSAASIPLTSAAYCEHYIGKIRPMLVLEEGIGALQEINRPAKTSSGNFICLEELVRNWPKHIPTALPPDSHIAGINPELVHESCPAHTFASQVSTNSFACVLLQPGDGSLDDRTQHSSCPPEYSATPGKGGKWYCWLKRPMPQPGYSQVKLRIYQGQTEPSLHPVSARTVEDAIHHLNRRMLASYGAASRDASAPSAADFCSNFLKEQAEALDFARILPHFPNMAIRRLRTPTSFARNITDTQYTAIYYYMGIGYEHINQRIWKGEVTEADQSYISQAIAGLNRLPPHRGTVLRLATLPSNVLEQHQVGSVVTYPAFTSTSRNMEFRWAGKHRFTIHARHRGRYVDPLISLAPNSIGEEEVLFPPNSRFKVLSREEKPNGQIHFVMVEVDENGNPYPEAP